jgi:hypothetical protein
VNARVTDVRYRGTHTDYRLETALGSVLLREPGPARLQEGAVVSLTIERVWRMPDAPRGQPKPML